jgi:hypothetical protein
MSTVDLTEPRDLASLLFGSPVDDPGHALGQRLAESGAGQGLTDALGRLGSTAAGTARDEVARAASGLLSRDLGDVLVAGWRTYDALRQAALRSRADPASSEVVSLVTHHVRLDHALDVDVYLDTVRLETVEVVLAVVLRVDGLAAVVRDGRLTDLRGGECRAHSTLTVAGVTAVAREARFLPGVVVPLGDGVALLGAETGPGASTLDVRPASPQARPHRSPGP